MIFIKNIYKKYRSKKYVLRNINLNFPDKGLVTILGASGSGKTTLLNLIGGLDKATKGEIYIDRININKLIKDNTLYTNYISFIFQNYNLIDNLSVNDNVDMFNDKNNDTLLKKLSILNKKNNNINELSGGQQQRVAIARAIAKNTKIILCDEPTGALDHETSHSIMKLLKAISKEKLVIVITHNKELSKLYSDRVIHIKDGVIESDSSPHLITEKKSN